MEIVKVLRGEADLEKKTYIVWTLPFVILLSFVFLAEYFVFFDKIMIRIISVLGFFGPGYSMLVYLAIFFGSFAFVFILSGKRFQELDISWHYAFLLLPFFYIVYLYLVFKEEPRWKIAERAKKNRKNEIM